LTYMSIEKADLLDSYMQLIAVLRLTCMTKYKNRERDMLT
jgi:hypothetical protein